MEIIAAFTMSLLIIPVIIFLVGFGMKLLGEILYVESPRYYEDLDDELEGYINGPNRWD